MLGSCVSSPALGWGRKKEFRASLTRCVLHPRMASARAVGHRRPRELGLGLEEPPLDLLRHLNLGPTAPCQSRFVGCSPAGNSTPARLGTRTPASTVRAQAALSSQRASKTGCGAGGRPARAQPPLRPPLASRAVMPRAGPRTHPTQHRVHRETSPGAGFSRNGVLPPRPPAPQSPRGPQGPVQHPQLPLVPQTAMKRRWPIC